MSDPDGPDAPPTPSADLDTPLDTGAQVNNAPEVDSDAERVLPDPIPHAGLRYSVLRLLMLMAVGGVLYVAGMRGWLLAFAAVLVSGIVSLFLFMKQRNDAAVNLERTVDHWKHRRAAEDARVD